MEDTLLDSKAAAAFLGITVANLLMRKKSRKWQFLAPIKVNGKLYFSKENLRKSLNPIPSDLNLVTIKEAAKLLNISAMGVRSRIMQSDGKLVPVRIEHRIYLRMEDLQKMIDDDVKKQDLIHDMLNIKEAAVFLGINENVLRLRKVNKWCKLVPVKIGHRIYFRKDDLVKILTEQQNNIDPDLLRVSAAAQFLGCRVHKLKKFKDLPFVKIDNHRYFHKSDLNKVKMQQPQFVHEGKTYVKDATTGEWIAVQQKQ
ncbi:MAG: Helix-turn-helix domain [Pseudomonadota bacterium]|jgi:hypothetical protein